VSKLRHGNATVADLYVIVAKNKVNSKDNFNPVMATVGGFLSFAVWPFYATLTAILVLGYCFVFQH
jgi:hypothetical protein